MVHKSEHETQYLSCFVTEMNLESRGWLLSCEFHTDFDSTVAQKAQYMATETAFRGRLKWCTLLRRLLLQWFVTQEVVALGSLWAVIENNLKWMFGFVHYLWASSWNSFLWATSNLQPFFLNTACVSNWCRCLSNLLCFVCLQVFS